jgi:hypothetical protein
VWSLFGLCFRGRFTSRHLHSPDEVGGRCRSSAIEPSGREVRFSMQRARYTAREFVTAFRPLPYVIAEFSGFLFCLLIIGLTFGA